jgi:DHA1 family bicyclomycin/chloramphenicol resistance-like MFS transporter
MALAPLAAPIIGGVILVTLSWHYIFVFLAVLTLVGMALFLRNIPETLPREHRVPLSLRNILSNYRRLARHPVIMGYILAGSFHFAGLMCFITGAAFIYIELYHVPEQYFGFYMGLNVVSMMVATTLNRRYVDRLGLPKLTRYGIHVLAVSAILLFALAVLDMPPLMAIMLGCMLYTGTMGVLGGGLMAGAMRYSGKHNGSVTALAGTFRFTSGALSGAIVSALHDGSQTPMLVVMASCATLAILAWFWTIRTERSGNFASL